MKTLLASSTSFVARPFIGLSEMGSCLAETILRVGDSVFHPGRIELSRDNFPLASASLEIYFSSDLPAHLASLGVSVSEVKLAVIAEGSVIADSEVVFEEPLDDVSSPISVQLAGNPLVFDSPNGFDLSVLLVLEKRQRSISPELEQGVWLALEQFQIAPYSTQNMFAPIPLDEQLRSAIGAPRGCLSFVRIGEDLLVAETLEDQVEIYVDLEVLRLLHEDPNAPLSQMIQLEMAVSVYSLMILKVASQLLEFSMEDDQVERMLQLPIGRILADVGQSHKMQIKRLVEIANSEPGLLKAIIEDHLKALKVASVALREVQ